MQGSETAGWESALRRDGFAHFRAAVPARLVAAARESIQRDVDEHFDPARLDEYNHQSWCPGLRRSRSIRRLFDNPAVRTIVDEALGKNRYGVDDGQIALRQAHNAAARHAPTAHIDGIPTAHNGLKGAGLQSFTALLGIFLTEVKSEFAGNFTVWPGSHLRFERYFQERGEKALADGMPAVDLGAPRQLLCSPGDLVFCHYQLAHAAAVNTSDHDRIAVFFRLWFHEIAAPEAHAARWHHLTHLWQGWQI